MQSLTIKDFGPIKTAEIEIKDVLLFIGPQASGKSTISKAIYFFKSLRDDLFRYLLDILNGTEPTPLHSSISNFGRRAREKFLGIYGPVTHFTSMRLHYDYGNGFFADVEPAQDTAYTNIWLGGIFSERFRLLVEITTAFRQNAEERKKDRFLSSREALTLEAEEQAFIQELERKVNLIFDDDREVIFLPAGRSLITTMSDQISNIDMSVRLDDLMRAFIRRINNLKPTFKNGLASLIREQPEQGTKGKEAAQESSILARSIIENILKGRYTFDPELGERLYYEEGYTKINYASSGQQEVVWILLLLFMLILNNRKVFIVIEEPEAHLYPVAQKQIIDLLALLANLNKNQIVITTHSPYILSSCNNLLYAFSLGQQKREQVAAIIEQSYWLDPQRLKAFMVAAGTIDSIMDEETKLLEIAAIDSASEIILETFDQLFNLDDA